MKAETITVLIHIAGSARRAEEACRAYFEQIEGCVAVTPTCYIYSGGSEPGVTVRLINYPPYPCTEAELMAKAGRLAEFLREQLGQQSYTIQGPTITETVGR